jgi:hypothetical protein
MKKKNKTKNINKQTNTKKEKAKYDRTTNNHMNEKKNKPTIIRGKQITKKKNMQHNKEQHRII